MDSGEADAAHELVVEETLEVPLLLPVEGALRELHGPLLVRDFGFLFGEVERIQRGEVVDEVNAGDSSLAGGALDPSVLSEVRQARRAEDMPANDEEKMFFMITPFPFFIFSGMPKARYCAACFHRQ